MKSIWHDLPQNARDIIENDRPDLAEMLKTYHYGRVVRIVSRPPLSYRNRLFRLHLAKLLATGIPKSMAVEMAAERFGLSWRHAYRIAGETCGD